MTLLRMPVFAWMTFVVAFLLLFAMPVIGVALWQLMFEMRWGAPFFNPAEGGDPVLWQHLFWLFGHPEVYIMILPAFGIVSEILPVFSRKPLFGYTAIVFSGIAIGFMGWGVWAHHMFTVGLGPVANSAFADRTMLIAVPTGIKIFNWVGTMFGGRIRFKTPMLFAVGLVAMFTIGGLSGVTHAIVPHDTQQHDTYYIVAHFHYVLFGGAIFGLLGGVYFWFPKIFGKMMNERLGKMHFWLMLIGFNLTFGPHAHPRPQRHAAAHLHLRRRAGLELLEPGLVGRRVHDRPVDPGLPHQRRHLDPPRRGRRRRPVGRPHPGVADDLAAAAAQLRRGPDRDLARRVLAPQVRRRRHRARARCASRPARRPTTWREGARPAGHDIHMPVPSYYPIVIAAGPADHGLRRVLRGARAGGPAGGRRDPHLRRHGRLGAWSPRSRRRH